MQMLDPSARRVFPPPTWRQFPEPVCLSELAARGEAPAGTDWVWDGFLFRGGVTLLSALPKAGKTTLVTRLINAVGCSWDEFAGRPAAAAASVVVSEESDGVWRERVRRTPVHGSRLVSRPFKGRPSPDEWAAYLAHLAGDMDRFGESLVVFDTLAALWPVRDENSATDVQAALDPIRGLADGRAVLLVHHLRKSDGADGTGARGSGALAGFADVLVELRRAAGGGPRRALKAVGRPDGVPEQWEVELDPRLGCFVGRDPAGAREAKVDRLRDAVLGALAGAGGAGLTFNALRAALPDDLRRSHGRLRDLLAAGTAADEWLREDRPSRLGGPVYRAHPGPPADLLDGFGDDLGPPAPEESEGADFPPSGSGD